MIPIRWIAILAATTPIRERNTAPGLPLFFQTLRDTNNRSARVFARTRRRIRAVTGARVFYTLASQLVDTEGVVDVVGVGADGVPVGLNHVQVVVDEKQGGRGLDTVVVQLARCEW